MLEDMYIGDLTGYSSELIEIVKEIRRNGDRIAGETWEGFYDRTYHLGLAELGRRQRQRRIRLTADR